MIYGPKPVAGRPRLLPVDGHPIGAPAMADDVRLIARHEGAEPYLGIVAGRHLHRRCNETLCRFIARAEQQAARHRESGWRLACARD